MRDRLIELLRQIEFDYAEDCVCAFEDGYKCAPDFAKYFVDHLLAEGVIVPKVKIGDKLYAINAARARVNEYIVTHLEMYECGIKIFGRPIYCRDEYWLCWSQDLGNDECCVFLTREEAEKALERSKE
jgi:hypothetical protein